MRKDLPNPLVYSGHTRPIVDLNFSAITPDGFFISSASKDGQPMVLNGESGDWIGTFVGHKGATWACMLDKPALRAVTASADYSARVWDALTGDELHNFEHPSVVRTAGFAQNKNTIVTGGMDKLVRIYDLDKPEAAPVESEKTIDKLRCVTFCQDDNLLLVSYIDRPNLEVWDARTLRKVRTLETGGAVTSAEVSKDGRYITTADGTFAKVWDGASFTEIKSLKSVNGIVESASYCAEANLLATGGQDMWVHVYDATTLEQRDVCKGHHGPVHCVRFSPTGNTLASGSEDGTIRIWQVESAVHGVNGA